MLKLYTDKEEFISNNQLFIQQCNYVVRAMFEVSLQDFGQCPTDFAARFEHAGEQVFAIRQSARPMFFTGNENAVGRFAQAMKKARPELSYIRAKQNLKDAFVRAWTKNYCQADNVYIMEKNTPGEKFDYDGIRKAEEENIPDLVTLLTLFYKSIDKLPESPSMGDLVRLKLPQCMIQVRDGKAVAMAYRTRDFRDSCAIAGVVTLPEYRGQKCASSLVSYMAKQIERQKKICYLFVDTTNMPAINAYHNAGLRTMKTYSDVHLSAPTVTGLSIF